MGPSNRQGAVRPSQRKAPKKPSGRVAPHTLASCPLSVQWAILVLVEVASIKTRRWGSSLVSMSANDPCFRPSVRVKVPQENWIGLAVPVLVDPAMFEAAQMQFQQTRQRKRA